MTMRTTIVVGAGACVPFGLPTGEQLKSIILSQCRSHVNSIIKAYSKQGGRLGCTSSLIQDFAKRFQRATTPSIDIFLEENPEWHDLGRMLIAAAIRPLEHSAIFEDKICGDWLSWIFNNIQDPIRKLQDGTISIVTFNYDRLIEASLYHILRNKYKHSHQQAQDKINHIDVAHVYGKIADNLEGLLEVDAPPTTWTADDNYATAWLSSRNIKVIGDQRQDDAAINEAKNRIESAGAVIILGFGFNKLNMRRIGLLNISSDGSSHSKEVMFSACGMLSGERSLAKRLLGGGMSVIPGDPSHGCKDFLRDICTDWIHRRYG